MILGIDLLWLDNSYKGGVEKVIFNLMDGFNTLNYNDKIILFCNQYGLNKLKHLNHKKYKIVHIEMKNNSLFYKLLIRTFVLQRLVKQEKVDVFLFPKIYTGFKKFNIPTVVIPHDIQFKRHPLQSRFKNFIVSILYYIDFHIRDSIIAISDFDKQEIEKFYPNIKRKITKIYNPIKINNYINTKQNNKYFIAINVGYRHKNILTLLKAFQKFSKKYKFNLILVGRNYHNLNINETIRRLNINEFVTYKEYVEQQELDSLLLNAFCYITTSKYEGFGLTVAEAIMYKIPVISSVQPALMEVSMGMSIYYSPIDDPDSLYRVMEKFIHNRPSDKYLERIRNKATILYNYKKISREYFEHFKSLQKE